MLLAQGLVPDAVVAGVVVALLLAVPSAAGASQRFATNGALVLGWSCLAWWPPCLAHIDHGAAIVALVLGGVVGRSFTHAKGAWGLLPVWSRVDLLVPLSGVAALGVMHGWRTVSRPEDALQLMLNGWDNSAHF